MGFTIDGLNLDDYIDKIEYLISHPKLVKEISEYNSNYIKKNHMASQCVLDIERSYKNLFAQDTKLQDYAIKNS